MPIIAENGMQIDKKRPTFESSYPVSLTVTSNLNENRENKIPVFPVFFDGFPAYNPQEKKMGKV